MLPPAPERRCRHPGRLRVPDRTALAGVLFVPRTGVAWRDVPAESGAAPGDSLAPAARPDRGRRMVRLHAAPLGELGPQLLQPRNPPMDPRRHRRNDAQLQSPRRLSAQRRDPLDVPPLTTAAGPGPQRAGPWPSGPAVRSCRGWAWGSNPRAFHRRRRRAHAIRLRHQPLGQHRQRRELPLKTQGRLGRAGVLLKPLQRVQGLPRHGDVKEVRRWRCRRRYW
ncbi:hypothetical protein [Streptomyces eurythermus]